MAAAEKMEKIEIKDRSGCTIKTEQIGDFVYCRAFPSDISKRQANGLNDIENEEFFDDDVLIVAYNRSGSHWTTEIVSMLMRGNTEYDGTPLSARNIELRAAELIPEHFNDIRPRLLQTHLPLFMFPAKLHKLRMIFVYRNPKDVAYSCYKITAAGSSYEYDGRFEDYIQLFQEGRVPFGDYFRFMNSWEKFIKENKKCCISYEQLSEDPISVIQTVASYLNIKTEKTFLQDIVNKCTLQKMKENTTLTPQKFKDGHDGFLRKGVFGDWKNHFTVAMSEEFDKVFARRMPDTQLEFQFEPLNSKDY